MALKNSDLPLQKVYHWAQTRGNDTYMVQPLGNGQVKEYSWSETLDQAKRMAAYLQAQNFAAGSRIAILSKNCAEFIIADLAIWMAGHASVAIYPTSNAETVQYILEHSESQMLFVGKLDEWEEMKPGVPQALPCVAFSLAPPNDYIQWDDIMQQNAPIEGEPVRDVKDIALLIYTSGSTGKPKGVVHSFETISVPANGVKGLFEMTQHDRQISYLPLAHVFERAVVELASMINGSKIFFAESLDTFAQDLQRAKPTVFHSVPRLWLKFQLGVFSKMPPKKLKRLLKIPILNSIVRKKILTALGLQDCRYALSGSAPIPADLIQWYRDLGLELLEGYAMSENFAYSHCSIPGQTRAGYVGNCFPGVDHKISESGEILVKSPGNMLEYFKMPEASKETFTEDGYLKTGDRGEIDSEGRLRITGRVKELFKTSKGKYISPAPIENLFNANPYVEQSCVAGAGEPACHAVILIAEDYRPKMQDPAVREEITAAMSSLLAEVNAKVEHHERLQFLAIAKDEWLIENGFLTPTMKIKRDALEATYGPKSADWYKSKEAVIWE